jgi:hypothetical protein
MAEPADYELPLEEMALLDFVWWDRYAGMPDDFKLFGWIDRPDGRSDFILLTVVPEGIGYTTSSAERAEEVSRRLNDGEKSETHNPCRRVEDHPAATSLPNVAVAVKRSRVDLRAALVEALGMGDGVTRDEQVLEAVRELVEKRNRLEPEPACESGLPDCGPATATDREGVPLCARCARELAADPKNHAVGCHCGACAGHGCDR